MTTRTSRKPRSRENIESYLLSEHQLEDMYYYMLLARRLNERMLVLNRQGRAPFVIAGAGRLPRVNEVRLIGPQCPAFGTGSLPPNRVYKGAIAVMSKVVF